MEDCKKAIKFTLIQSKITMMNRFRYVLIIIVIFSASFALSASPSFSVHIGGDFFNYEESFLDLGLSYLTPIAEEMEFYLSAHFAVQTEEEDGEIKANFYYPIDAGLNFLFSLSPTFTGLFGVGLSPQFLLAEKTSFYLGPSMKGGIRAKIHPVMEWMLEVQQDLVIGAPRWINTGTRVSTGIVFSFARSADD